MPTNATQPGQLSDVLFFEEDVEYSREVITGISGSNILLGQALGKTVTATATPVADGSNTGDGTMGAITESNGIMSGIYVLAIISEAANAGDFQFVDPYGALVGVGTVGTVFTGGGMSFTLADGATDFDIGDTFEVTVTAVVDKYEPLDLVATDGSQIAVAVALADIDASVADTNGVALMRHAVIRSTGVVWPAGITDDQKAIAVSQLAQRTIFTRVAV